MKTSKFCINDQDDYNYIPVALESALMDKTRQLPGQGTQH